MLSIKASEKISNPVVGFPPYPFIITLLSIETSEKNKSNPVLCFIHSFIWPCPREKNRSFVRMAMAKLYIRLHVSVTLLGNGRRSSSERPHLTCQTREQKLRMMPPRIETHELLLLPLERL